jgi:HSP20 family protein
MLGIDETIGEVERLYRTVTGQDVPGANGPYAPIPAEKDPSKYVMEQVERLTRMLGESELAHSEPPPSTPPLSVWETRDEVIVAVQMPGVTKEGLHVESRGRVVFVTGQRRPVSDSGRILVSEHPLGPYQRIIPLPEGTTAADLSAQINDGVLELRIRKKVVAQEARDIPVR